MKKFAPYILVIYLILGFVAVPLVLKPQLTSIITNNINGSVSIENVYFNPLTFHLEISGIALESEQQEKLFTLKNLVLNLELYSLLVGAIHVSDFTLDEPKVYVVLDNEKKLNFLQLIKQKDTPKENTEEKSGSLPRVILDNVSLIDGSVNYQDFTQKSRFELDVENINFKLQDVDTKNIDANEAHMRFYSKLEEGGFIDIKSEILAVEPLKLKGDISYESGKLYTKWRYVKDMLNIELADGQLSLNGEYFVDLGDIDSLALSNMNIALTNVRLKPKELHHQDILNLKYFGIHNLQTKPLQQELKIAEVKLDSLNVKASRDKNKQIDWNEYIKVNTAKENAVVKEDKATDSKDSKPWNVLVEHMILDNIQFTFNDNGIAPSVTTALNSLNLHAQNITLEGVDPIQYDFNFMLNDKLKCSSEGRVIHKVLNARTSILCKDFDITHYYPYIDEIAKKNLARYNLRLNSAIAGFDANITAKDVDKEIVVGLDKANFDLKQLKISQRDTRKRVLSFNNFKVNGIALDTAEKNVSILDTSLNGLRIEVQRSEDGHINLEDLVVAKNEKITRNVKVQKTKKQTKEEKPYRVTFKKVGLNGAKVVLDDYTLSPKAQSKIDQIYLTAYNVDSAKNTWLNYYMSARINNKGKVKSNGTIRHTPLYQKGKLTLHKVALASVNPYLQDQAFVYIDDGYVEAKLNTKYYKSISKPDLQVNGTFSIKDFFVNKTKDDSSLLSFRDFDLHKITLETEPNRFYVDAIDVNSFYVNAHIDANKTMNFAKLVKQKVEDNTTNAKEQVVQNDKNSSSAEVFPVKIAKLNINNGSAIFKDDSLPLPFKTNIHTLHGIIYDISTNKNEVTNVDISGEVDEYGSTRLSGSLNAFNPKGYTDLGLDFKNINLSNMSGYSGTFAGYKIDDGKLTLDLDYKINDSNLAGENNIVINKIELGDEIEVEGGSSLPLGLAIALLEDSQGVIDIDMPVRGNVDEPDFKYGALVFKTFFNLIIKAVASPFKFLGASLGIDGDELEYIEFEAGKSAILPSEKEKLDTIVELLKKRPKLALGVGANFDPDLDTKALQKAKLLELVAQRSDAKNEKESINALTIGLLEDIYQDIKDDDQLKKLEDKLEEKYDGDAFDKAYLEALVELCSSIQVVEQEELKNLALTRRDSVLQYFSELKKVDQARLQALKLDKSTKSNEGFVPTHLEVIVK